MAPFAALVSAREAAKMSCQTLDSDVQRLLAALVLDFLSGGSQTPHCCLVWVAVAELGLQLVVTGLAAPPVNLLPADWPLGLVASRMEWEAREKMTKERLFPPASLLCGGGTFPALWKWGSKFFLLIIRTLCRIGRCARCIRDSNRWRV